jgi:hypothetical protein
VQTGNNVAIAGFIVEGTSPKKVIVRALGPSLNAFGITDFLQDPTLKLQNASSVLLSNDNWESTVNAADIAQEYRPGDPREATILATLQPGSYTAIMAGNNGTTGTGLIEVYDLDNLADSKLVNVSTRGFVQTGDAVMIGGFIAAGGNGNVQVLVRAIGPSLGQFAITNALPDPILTLIDANGTQLAANDNWKNTQQTAIRQTGLAPGNDLESAILITVPAGNYTAIVAGKNGVTGVALVEVYRR